MDPASAPKKLKEEGITGEPGMIIFGRASWNTAYQIQADGSWRRLDKGLAFKLREDWEKRGRPEK